MSGTGLCAEFEALSRSTCSGVVRGDEDDRIRLLVDLRICLRAVLPGCG
jgi:hypothetical protein